MVVFVKTKRQKTRQIFWSRVQAIEVLLLALLFVAAVLVDVVVSQDESFYKIIDGCSWITS